MTDTAHGRSTAARLVERWRARRAAPGPDFSVTPAQLGLRLFEEIHPGTAANVLSFVAEVGGTLDLDRLGDALARLSERHPVLRAVFAPGAATWSPLPGPVGLELRASDSRADALDVARRVAAEPVDLAVGPPCRVVAHRHPRGLLLQLVAHHVVADGWSLGVFLGELCAAYAGAELPPAGIAQPAAKPVSEADLRYWRDALAGAVPVGLPTDRPRSARRRFGSAGVPVAVDGTTASAVAGLAAEEGATPFMVLLTALHLVLARTTGREDLVVGSAMATPERHAAPTAVGPLVTMVALRTDGSGARTGRDLLRAVRATCLGAYGRAHVPFEDVVAQAGAGRESVFDVLLVLQPALPRFELEGHEVRPVALAPSGVRHDLELYLWQAEDGLSGTLGYDPDLFDEVTARTFARRLGRAVASLVAAPDADVAELEVRAPEELAALARWASGPPVAESGLCLHELVESQVDRTPDATALRTNEETLTYAELDQRANSLAHHLITTHHTRPGDLIAVCLPRTAHLITTLLAILKTGAAYVPLDPHYPAQRTNHLITDSNATLLITTSQLDPGDRPVVLVDALEPTGPASRTGLRLSPSGLAYTIYTSGSTGRPKGVMIEHRQTTAMLTWARDTFPPEVLAETLAATSICFDLSVFEIFAPLTTGGTVVLTPDNALDLIHHPDAYRDVTLINTVPSAAAELLAADAIPPGARTINLAGEALSPGLVAGLLALPTVSTVNNLYGPSEDTTYSTHAITTPNDPRTPIGRPIHGTTVHILDANLTPVPLGAIGELYLSGAGITRGYHNQPATTAEKYLPAPNGQRLYRTGDLARWRTDGQLDYHGRTDNQTKIRGHRIEPEEVETTLRAHPEVTAAAVTVHGGSLVGYVVGGVSAAEVLRLARTALPEHMVPAHVVVLPELPMTPNGKVDRNALPAPVVEPAGSVAPRTPAERLLVDLWAELLGVRQIGVEDDFFRLGGHSLLATRLVHRLGEHLGAVVPLRLVFDHPVLEDLAARLPSQGVGAEAVVLPRRAREDGTVVLPASPGQRRLWLLCALDEDANTAYHITGAARIGGGLDVAAMASALRVVAERHEALRTTLRADDGEITQVIHPTWEWDPLADGPDTPELWAATTTRLDRGPLFRARVLTAGADEHVLLVSLHHAIADGWSLGVLLDEVARAYRGEDLGAPPVQYADVAASRAEPSPESLDHWRERLAGAAVLDLPTDRPRGARQTHGGAAVPVGLDADAVRTAARAGGTTEFAVVAAAVAVLLAKSAGQHDVTIGVPTTGRRTTGSAGVVGFLADSVPLRQRTDDRTTLAEALAGAHAGLLDAHRYDDVPFERLVQHLAPERDRSRSALFQVMVAVDADPPRGLELPGLSVTRLPLPPAGTQFDLSLHLESTGDALDGYLTFNTDLFDEPTAARFTGRLAEVVRALAVAPSTTVASLDVTGPGERATRAALETGVPRAPRGGTLHGLVESQVDRTPDATALRTNEETLTYAELDQRANSLAHHLITTHHTRPGDLIAVCLPRTAHLITTLLAILKTGAAYVPLDPHYPAQRTNHLITDSNATLLITTSTTGAPVSGRPTALVDELEPGRGDLRPNVPVAPESLAYTIYTSGSTGRPKGVMIEHRQTTAMLTWARDTFPPEVVARTLASTSICFDLSVFEIFAPLTTGGTVVLTPDNALDLIHNPDAYRDVTLINTVPSIASELLAANALPPQARTINLAGEALSPKLVTELLALPTVSTVNNLYGPSEDTTYSTHAITTPNDPRTPIGRPIHGTTAHVLDNQLNPVPLGTIGELYLSGAGITRGYHNQPATTAEKYLPAPNGQRLYRTGDLARWRTDGQLDYHGRTDNQTKIRGHRIEPEEIETVLRAHPEVTAATVAARAGRLVGYVVSEGVGHAELADHLRARLPEQFVPSVFVDLAELPMTPNGKVDRNALPEPTSARAELSGRAPETVDERLVARVWAEVLDVPESAIGVDDDFFRLGGHSLLATRLVHRLGAALGAAVPLSLVFDHPSVAGQARRLPRERVEPIPVLGRVAGPDGSVVLPASAGQQRLWVLCQLDPDANRAYHITGAAEVDGALDVGVLAEAVRRAAVRHEALRTVLREVDEELVQVVSPEPRAGLVEGDWADELARPLNLGGGRALWKAVLTRTGPDRHVLGVSLHHAIADGWSVRVLLGEITEQYRALLTDPAAAEPEAAPVQFADVAAWQAGRRGDLAHWVEASRGAPPLALATDRPRPARQTHGGAAVPLDLPVAELRAVASGAGTSVFAVLAAAVAVALAAGGGSRDITVGTPVSGREHPDTVGVLGFLVDTLPLRLRAEPTMTLAQVVAAATEAARAVARRGHVSFADLVRELAPERDQSRSPVFQVMVAVNGTPGAYELPGLRVRPVPVAPTATPFDLVFQVEEDGERVDGWLVRNTDLFDESTARLLVRRVGTVVEAMAAAPLTALAELDVRPADERARAEDLARGVPQAPSGTCAHELVQAQVDRTPDAIALRAGDGNLTYAQLDRAANRLAHRLRGLGVGPEDRVAVCLPRTSRLVVSLLGVLASGAAYVPVDPAYPAERIELLLADSGAAVLITDEGGPAPDGVVVLRSAVEDGPVERVASGVGADNLAYVIHTSGSTGRPKGVMIEHRQTTAMLTWARDTFPPEVLAETLAATSICFDLSVFEIFAPLTTGGTITLAPDNALDLIHNPDAYHHLTLVNTVPSAAAELLAADAIPPGARTINLAGEALSPALVDQLYQHPVLDTVNNLYGPSEDTTYSTHAITTPNDPRTPIGRPIHGTTVHILDADLTPVPLGAIGELYLSGAGITRGYHNQPATTAEKYLPAPNGQRLYRTGDLARWRTDGQLDYHGRTDNQTKIRGHRIEPEEVETTLRAHPGVLQAAVAARGGSLVGYVVGDVDPGEVLRTARAALPPALVPTRLVALAAMPMTPNGKVDRNALPEPTSARAAGGPPRTANERLVAEIWTELLELDELGVDDDFFAVGGHSLLASRVVSRIAARTGTRLPLRAVFDHPTVAGLASHLPEVAAPVTIPRVRRTPHQGQRTR